MSNGLIGIINVGLGNIRSVANAVYELGYDYLLLDDIAKIDDVTHVILPGVGHFAAAMNALTQFGFVAALQDFKESGRPILGICLGMQLLATKGQEGGETTGLNLIQGEVIRIDVDELRIPHVGWNSVDLLNQHPVFSGVKNQRDFYFVHSYHFCCADDKSNFGVTDYGGQLTTIVASENVLGFQFHPEKSQKNGLLLLDNFCDWDGAC